MPRTTGLQGYSDVHFTDVEVAKLVVTHFKPAGRILEPCRGAGAFLAALPEGTDWCEISEGVDFFQHTGVYDWIVTNPPFEHMTDWLRHAFDLSQNVLFVIPLSKLYSSVPRMQLVKKYGGVRETLYLGSGRSIGFDIGFPFGAVWFQRDYRGPCDWTWSTES